jgi:hypothetical protein
MDVCDRTNAPWGSGSAPTLGAGLRPVRESMRLTRQRLRGAQVHGDVPQAKLPRPFSADARTNLGRSKASRSL